jgi:hypothetical protein
MVMQIAEGILVAAGALFVICFVCTGLYHGAHS